MPDSPTRVLRRGWTTGTCASAAAKAAYAALRAGQFLDPVTVTLPRGERPSFALARAERGPDWARAGVIKDAGDDPDVTHGALILATVRLAAAGSGVAFLAGEGVGTVTLPGLALAPGEPAINPVPRSMIRAALAEVEASLGGGGAPDAQVEISIPGGAALAQRTLNARLGILGGLSILGTTGIVVPYSCSAWIHSIQRGVDVARAAGLEHLAGATGATSERAVRDLHGLPELALIDMGDLVGGMLKYLHRHPVARVSVAGGVAKLSKLAQGELDLHSRRGAVDLAALAEHARQLGAGAELTREMLAANTAAQAFELAGAAQLPLGDAVAQGAWQTAAAALARPESELEVALFDRGGRLVGRAPFAPAHASGSGRKRRA